MKKIDENLFAKLWTEGVQTREISEAIGITTDQCDATRRRLGLPRRKGWANARKQRDYMPTEAEIRAKCLEFQATWSDEERDRRRGYKPIPLETAFYPDDLLDENQEIIP